MATKLTETVVIPLLNSLDLQYGIAGNTAQFRVGDERGRFDLDVAVIDMEMDDPALAIVVRNIANIAPDDREDALVTCNEYNMKIRGKLVLDDGQLMYVFDVEVGSENGIAVLESALRAALSFAAGYYVRFQRSKDLGISEQVLDHLREVIDNDDSEDGE